MSALLVIVPSRGRPQNVAALCRAFRDTGATSRLLFGFDQDDPYARRGVQDGAMMTTRPRMRLNAYTNALATEFAGQYKFLGSMGDDHRPRTLGWDVKIRTALTEMGTGIVYGDDLLQGANLPTACFMSSDIVRTLGYMAPPCLEHMCIDNFWRDLGQAIGRLRFLPDVIIEHLHPAAGKAPQDPGYAEADSKAAADGAAYREYLAGGGFVADVARVQKLILRSKEEP